MDEKNALEELRMMSDRLHNEECIQDIVASDLTFVADRIEREWVELPQSADGKIWTGREVCFWTNTTEAGWHRFNGLVYICGEWYAEDTEAIRYKAGAVWYERPDNWERIADELEAWCDAVDVDEDACDKPRELADRIRKLAEKEG